MRVLYVLSLLGVSAGLWLLTDLVSDLVLSRSTRPANLLQTSTYPTARLSQRLTIVAIEAKVNHRSQSTEVTLETANSSLSRLEFEYPLVEPEHLELALVNELGIVPQSLRRLIRYRVD